MLVLLTYVYSGNLIRFRFQLDQSIDITIGLFYVSIFFKQFDFENVFGNIIICL